MGRGYSETLPAPTLGWNTRDPISEMKSGYAVLLDNYFPDSSRCTLRLGYREHSSGLGAAVKTVLAWEGLTSRKLFGFAGNKIWDATTFAGSASDVTAGSTITSDIWYGQNFGGRLTIVNGADTPRQWNGSAWADTTFTGVTQANLANIWTYRSRLYFPEISTLKVWYGGADSISGALTSFDMQYVFRLGGTLIAGGALSRDAGSGADDVCVFASSLGEVLVYEGGYPGDTAWRLIGRYYTAPPIGRRCLVSIGGDLAIVTTAGLIPMSKIIAQGRDKEADIALTALISPTVNQAARDYGANNGWQAIIYPRGTRGMINVPTVDASAAHQYVWNTLTGAWCRFRGMNALCWTIYNDKPYFGAADGSVYEADATQSDDATDIVGDIRPAFSYLRRRGMRKVFHLAKPSIVADATAELAVDLEVDYAEVDAANLVSLSGDAGTAWDDGDWDDFDWAAGVQTYATAYGVTGIGDAASLRIRSSTQNVTISLNAYSLWFSKAGWL